MPQPQCRRTREALSYRPCLPPDTESINAPTPTPASKIQFGMPPNIDSVNQSVAGGVALLEELELDDEPEPPEGGGGGGGGGGGRTH